MKLSTLTIFLLFSSAAVSVSHAQQVISDEQAVKSLRHFYVFYIKYLSDAQRHKTDSLTRKYSTAGLTEQLKEQEEEDYNFIVNAQGAEVEWLKTLTVTKDRKEKGYL